MDISLIIYLFIITLLLVYFICEIVKEFKKEKNVTNHKEENKEIDFDNEENNEKK